MGIHVKIDHLLNYIAQLKLLAFGPQAPAIGVQFLHLWFAFPYLFQGLTAHCKLLITLHAWNFHVQRRN